MSGLHESSHACVSYICVPQSHALQCSVLLYSTVFSRGPRDHLSHQKQCIVMAGLKALGYVKCNELLYPGERRINSSYSEGCVVLREVL